MIFLFDVLFAEWSLRWWFVIFSSWVVAIEGPMLSSLFTLLIGVYKWTDDELLLVGIGVRSSLITDFITLE
jgi:hypothetical protein